MLSPARSAWCTKKLNSIGTLIQRTTTEAPQGHMYYIGLDVHKKTISYCVKDASGQVHQEGQIGATRWELGAWMKTLPQPWTVAMEATIFTGWIYDHLLPHAQQVKGSASADAARHRCGQEEERSHRCRQDRRLPALRLPAGMPHGIHRDSRQTPNPALPTPAGAPDGADEESDLRSADGNRSEPQQAAAAQSGVFP